MKFQQDNAKIHVSRSTKRWFEAQNIPLLDWPNRSPDLNPMENLWAILARRVYANNKQYETVQELKDVITTAFAKLDQEVITLSEACRTEFISLLIVMEALMIIKNVFC